MVVIFLNHFFNLKADNMFFTGFITSIQSCNVPSAVVSSILEHFIFYLSNL